MGATGFGYAPATEGSPPREDQKRKPARRKPARRKHPPREDGGDTGKLAPQVKLPFKPVEWES